LGLRIDLRLELVCFLATVGTIPKIACARPVGCTVFLPEQHKKVLNQFASNKNFYKFFFHAINGNVGKGLENFD
jgi:hypothetical protein